jgi:uncharacterized protein YqjF (DUF2071 family)
VNFQSVRRDGCCPFNSTYQPVGEIFHARPGSLETFLVERYCLYGQYNHGKLYRLEIHHHPWPLQIADGSIDAGDLLASHGLHAPGTPLLHFAQCLDVVTWMPESL